MESLKLVVLLVIYGITGNSTQSLPCHTASGDNCTSSICPNTVVTYTCTITSGTPGGLTDWTLPTGTCPSNTFPDKIRLLQYVSQQCAAVVTSTCGPYRASSIQSSDPTYCLSSILTVNITAAMNGSTVMCSNTNIGTAASTIVSMATINVAPNAVANTIGSDMVLVVVNPSSSGGLPTSYSITISNSSYVYSNSTPAAFLNGFAIVTFTGLTIGTNYTVSAVAINCAGSSNATTIYVSFSGGLQFTAESSLTLAHFVTGYVTKAEKSNMQEVWQVVNSNSSIYSKLWSFGVRSLRSRECGLYEASDLLLGDHLTEKSVTVKWVDAAMPQKRKRRLKSHKKLVEFEKLDPSSTDILEGSMVDIFYPARPKDLENVCLYDFIQWYEYHGASSDGTRVYQKLYTPLLPNHKLLSAQLCSTQSLPCHTASGDNCPSSICPNTVVIYTCTITSGTPGGYTDWTLPSGTCLSNTFPDKIRLSQFVSGSCSAQGQTGISTCGPYRASSIQSSDPTYCLSSILTVNITAAMNGSTVMCYNTNFITPSITTIISMATINVVGSPGRPNAVANTIGPGMVLVVVNPSSSGGLPTSYNVTISNSSYVYSNSTPAAFLNGFAIVTFTGLTIGTNYTISVAINCAGSSNPTTIYISCAHPLHSSLLLTVTASNGAFTATTTVYVYLTDVNDNPPQMTNLPTTISLSELTAVGTQVFTVSAIDKDQTFYPTYTIASSNDQLNFSITLTSISTLTVMVIPVSNLLVLVKTQQTASSNSISSINFKCIHYLTNFKCIYYFTNFKPIYYVTNFKSDVLVADWERGRPAACDVTVISPPTQAAFLNDAGTASAVAESHKHVSKGPNCQELGRVCVPLAVETYGN
ncbi:hypothetical protein EMCRGX_G012130 [Ephydatia muelleri]